MMWGEFLEKTKAIKARGGKLGFNAGVITRLIYAGAFNSMVIGNPDYMDMPPHQRCLKMTKEALAVLKSKAELPKASKTELIGIADIRNDAGLVLWRSIVNPLFKFNLTALFGEHLKNTRGFQWAQTGDTKAIPMVLSVPNKPGCDLYSQWDLVYSKPESMTIYQNGTRRAAVIGIVTKTNPLPFKGNKKALKVWFFDGYKEHEVVLWPEKGQNDYNKATAAYLNKKPCSVGLLLIKPDMYRGNKTGNLTHYYDIPI